jgi:DNA-binding transcriptional LysR family regulator
MMDWDKLRIFHTVAEAGSFTHAGERLNLSQSAISRQIGALEEGLGQLLFHRHARGLILTEQGELLHRTVRTVFQELTMVESRLSDNRERPSGPLKISTTVAFGSSWLTPRIKDFIELYPEIEISLLLTDEEVDLSMREADIAIRMAPPRQPDLIQRRLLTLLTHIYASPSYLEKNGVPKTVEDLEHHRLIIYGFDTPPPVASINWLLDVGTMPDKRRKAVLRVNNLYGVYRAARSGLGLAALPDYMIPEDIDITRVLPELSGPSIQTYFVYPEELRHSKRISIFRDFLLQKVAEIKP